MVDGQRTAGNENPVFLNKKVMRNASFWDTEKRPPLYRSRHDTKQRTLQSTSERSTTLPLVFLQPRVSHVARFCVRIVKSKRRR